MQYFTLKILGLTRRYPITHISKNTRLVNVSILGDIELVNKLADYWAQKLTKISFDYLVCPEVKVVPLVHGVALRSGHKRFVVCRKSVKPYMVNPVILKPLPHFPKHIKQLVINGADANLLTGKKVIIMDDVISTGVTIRMMKKLMEKVEARVVKLIAVFKQGQQFDEIENLFYLTELPIFKDNCTTNSHLS